MALQIIHQMDVSPELDADAALRRYFDHLATGGGTVEDDDEAAAPPARVDRPMVEALVRGVWTNRERIDDALGRLSRNWRLERMAVVDRNIIRLALYELEHSKDVPSSVILNEAVELAKCFGTTEGSAFVNGLLDRALTELDLRR